MTPEVLKRGNEIIREVTKLKERLEKMQAQKESLERNHLEPKVSLIAGNVGAIILQGEPDADMINMVYMMAESRIKARVNELQEEFEALG